MKCQKVDKSVFYFRRSLGYKFSVHYYYRNEITVTVGCSKNRNAMMNVGLARMLDSEVTNVDFLIKLQIATLQKIVNLNTATVPCIQHSFVDSPLIPIKKK